jgi:hypothetical protein
MSGATSGCAEHEDAAQSGSGRKSLNHFSGLCQQRLRDREAKGLHPPGLCGERPIAHPGVSNALNNFVLGD